MLKYKNIDKKAERGFPLERRINDENAEFFFQCVLKLKTVEDCRDFFEDLCTVQEIRTISQRLAVAKLLSEKRVYSEIVA